MASPRPVPPNLRLVLASACWNASKMMRCFSAGMPMPLSDTSKETTPPWPSIGWPVVQPPVDAETVSRTPPCAVNLKAFESRFFSTCCSRLASVTRLRPSRESTCTSKDRPRLSASCLKVRPTMSSRLVK